MYAVEAKPGSKVSPTELRTVQDWIVTPLLKGTPGLAGVDSLGGYTKEYLVVPDVQRMAAMRITLNELATALDRNNGSIGAGVVNRNGEGLAVRADGRIRTVDELARTVVVTRESVPITLDQIATVRTGHGPRMGSASENGREVVVGTAVMRIGENSRTVSTAVADRLTAIGRSLPVVPPQPVSRSEAANARHDANVERVMASSFG